MRKCYVADISHDKPAYWDTFLNRSEPRKVFDFTYNKYVAKFDRFVPEGARILEGGCGLGQYVYYYTEKDFPVEGVDFSDNLIRKARSLNSKASFKVADIRNLPFKDESFDVYISNGVLEHFEEGPEKMLGEAERVLAKNGTLIVTLQYLNLTRALVDFVRFFSDFLKPYWLRRKAKDYQGANIKGTYKLVRRFTVEGSPYFHSYFFSKREALDVFKKFNFEIKHILPLSVENGLGDYKFFRTALRRFFGYGKVGERGKKRTDRKTLFYFAEKWVKRTFIQEEPKDPLGFILLRALQVCFGSMILIVCRKSETKLDQVTYLSDGVGYKGLPKTTEPAAAEETVEDYFAKLNIEGKRNVWENNRKKIDYVLRKTRKYLKPPSAACDIGIGDGYLLMQLKARGLNVTGIDVSSYSINCLQDYFKRKGLNIRLIQGDISDITLEDNKFQVITCFDVLEHIPNLEVALEALKKSFTEGGVLIGTLPVGEHLDENMVMCPECGHKFHRIGHFHSFEAPEEVVNLLSRFTIIEMGEVPFHLFTAKIMNFIYFRLFKFIKGIFHKRRIKTVYFVARFDESNTEES